RDIFGNPFRPVVLDLARRKPTVTALAQAAYDERIQPSGTLDPARLAVLADSLEEAGCDPAGNLAHLRCPGAHSPGRWAGGLPRGRGAPRPPSHGGETPPPRHERTATVDQQLASLPLPPQSARLCVSGAEV